MFPRPCSIWGTTSIIGGGDTATCCKKYETEAKATRPVSLHKSNVHVQWWIYSQVFDIDLHDFVQRYQRWNYRSRQSSGDSWHRVLIAWVMLEVIWNVAGHALQHWRFESLGTDVALMSACEHWHIMLDAQLQSACNSFIQIIFTESQDVAVLAINFFNFPL